MWQKIAAYAIDHIKVRSQSGVDREGVSFPAYTPEYAKQKARGFVGKRSGKRPQAFKGISLERQTGTPNFRLRGFTLRDLSLRAASNKGATIGWRGEFANIVAANEERGKYKVGGVSDKEFDKILEMVDQEFVGQWNRRTHDVSIEVKL